MDGMTVSTHEILKLLMNIYLFMCLPNIARILCYFLGYKMEVFPSKTMPKNLDLSYKMDLDLRDC